MLAQNFLTPSDLKIKDDLHAALIQVLGMLERGELIHARSVFNAPCIFTYAYKEKIAGIPGVTTVSWLNWFGGTYIDKDQFFARQESD